MIVFWLSVSFVSLIESVRPRRAMRIALVVAVACGSVWEAASLAGDVRSVALREPTVDLGSESAALSALDAAYLKGVYEMGDEASSLVLRLLFPGFILSWLLISDMISQRANARRT